MINPHDETYHQLLRHVLAEGDSHADRTGVGTTSVFGYQCRYDLAAGFPLLTTKRMAWKSIVVELAWFLLGRTDNQWLEDRGVTIWREWRRPYSLDRAVAFVDPRPRAYQPLIDQTSLSLAGFAGDKDSEDAKLAAAWKHMMERCYDPLHHNYHLYGGCGASVCAEWQDVGAFICGVKKLPHWWYKQRHWNAFELDKDYYGAGQYGPETSVWLRTDENNKYMKSAKPVRVTDASGNTDVYLTLNDASQRTGIPLTTLSRWLRHAPSIVKGDNKAYLGWQFDSVDVDGKLLRLALIPEGDLGSVYGAQWRRFGSGEWGSDGVDQIKALCEALGKDPNSRRLCVSAWNAPDLPTMALAPCHTLWQCKVRSYRREGGGAADDRFLDLQLYQRSADSFLGVPFNIASYALLLQLLAHTHNMKPGRFIHTFGDLHIYNNHREQVQTQLARTPFPAPQLALPEGLRGRGFDGVLRWAEAVGHAALDSGDFIPTALTGYQCHPSIKAEVAV